MPRITNSVASVLSVVRVQRGVSSMRQAVFLDRDGTLIVDHHYLRDPELVTLLPDVIPALKALRDAGYLLIVISNQSGVGRGWIQPEEAERVHARFERVLKQQGVSLDASYYCAHAPDGGCACRKPKPGLILQAAKDWNLDLSQSIMIGNKACDVDAGRAAGCRTILFGADAHGVESAELMLPDWNALPGDLSHCFADRLPRPMPVSSAFSSASPVQGHTSVCARTQSALLHLPEPARPRP